MTAAQRRYVIGETLISVLINCAISACFAWLVFGGKSSISTRALIPDSIPQSFMITLMSVLVPGVLTARRLKAGRLEPVTGPLPKWRLPGRAVGAALIAILVGLGFHAVISFAISEISFPVLMAIKVAYGAALAAAITPFMLTYALRQIG